MKAKYRFLIAGIFTTAFCLNAFADDDRDQRNTSRPDDGINATAQAVAGGAKATGAAAAIGFATRQPEQIRDAQKAVRTAEDVLENSKAITAEQKAANIAAANKKLGWLRAGSSITGAVDTVFSLGKGMNVVGAVLSPDRKVDDALEQNAVVDKVNPHARVQTATERAEKELSDARAARVIDPNLRRISVDQATKELKGAEISLEEARKKFGYKGFAKKIRVVSGVGGAILLVDLAGQVIYAAQGKQRLATTVDWAFPHAEAAEAASTPEIGAFPDDDASRAESTQTDSAQAEF